MNTNETLKDRIVREIRSGELGMRPHAYFTVQLAALVVLVLAVLTISIFLVNFISFSVRAVGDDALLGFGVSGGLAFLRFFPWALFALDLALILLLSVLLRNFKFGYRTPTLYLLGVLAVAVFALGVGVERETPLNAVLERGGNLPPPFARMYEGVRRSHGPGSGICRCDVVSVEDNIITVSDARLGTSTIRIVVPLDDPRATTTSLRPGDRIFIAGREDDGVIHAFGIRKERGGPEREPRPDNDKNDKNDK